MTVNICFGYFLVQNNLNHALWNIILCGVIQAISWRKTNKHKKKTILPVGSSLWRSGNFWFMWRSWLGTSAFKIGHQHSYLCKYDLMQSYVGDGSLWLVRLRHLFSHPWSVMSNWWWQEYLPQQFSMRVILPPRGHLSISGDIFCHNWGFTTDI